MSILCFSVPFNNVFGNDINSNREVREVLDEELKLDLFNEHDLYDEKELLAIMGIEENKYYIDEEILKHLSIEDLSNLGDMFNEMRKNTSLNMDELNNEAANLLLEISLQNKNNRSSGSLQSSYDRLNAREKDLILRYPLLAPIYYSVSSKAENDAKYYYSAQVLVDDNGDDFRHSYWNALMAERFGYDSRLGGFYDISYGISVAKLFADAREYGHYGIDADMDYYNNEVGRNIFRRLANSMSWYENYVSDSKIRDAVLSDVSKGFMRILIGTGNNKRLGWSDSYGRIR